MNSFAVSRKTSGPIIPATFITYFYRQNFIFTNYTLVTAIVVLCLAYSFTHWMKDMREFLMNYKVYKVLKYNCDVEDTKYIKQFMYEEGFAMNFFWLLSVPLIFYTYVIVGLLI